MVVVVFFRIIKEGIGTPSKKGVVDGMAPGLKSIRPGSILEAPTGIGSILEAPTGIG